jgi:triosephosphate isomerase
MRRPLIAGNWKMYKTHLEAIHLVEALGHELATHDFGRVEVAVCPPFTALRSIQTTIEDRRYSFGLGAQNVYLEPEGAFTGEISAPMLKSLRVNYVIIGHSERREIFGETDEMVSAKVKAALAHDLVPILCCGETEQEREQGATESKVETQIRAAFAGVNPERARGIVVAYEPIWAIGTGKTATPDDAQATISYIRTVLSKEYDEDLAQEVRILYGGSVKSGNAAALMKQPDIDGGLVGGASLEAGEFASIVKASL